MGTCECVVCAESVFAHAFFTQTLLEQLKREYVAMQAKQNVLEKLVHAESAADVDAVLASRENVLVAKERNDLALRQAESERRAALHRVTEIIHELTLGKRWPLRLQQARTDALPLGSCEQRNSVQRSTRGTSARLRRRSFSD